VIRPFCQAVGNILKANGIEPAPQRKRNTSRKTFLKAHWDVLGAIDFTNVAECSFRLFDHTMGGRKVQGNRILFFGESGENAFQDGFVPACLESFAADATF